MKNLTIIILFFSFNTVAQNATVVNWVKANAVALDSSYGMKSIVESGEVQILGLGEASHGQGSFFIHKAQSFKWLVQNAGYKIFALEAGFSEALRINDYVLDGQGDPEVALKYLNYGVWQVETYLELIQWMREYNIGRAADEKISFYGFDCQMAKGAVDYLKSNEKHFAFTFTPADLDLFDDLIDLQISRDRSLAKKVFSKVCEFETRFSKAINQSTVDIKMQATTQALIKNLRYFCETQMGNEKQNSLNRSKYMAENVGHILEIEGNQVKMVISGHNGHLYYYPKAKETGYWLKQKYSSKYYALGYEFNYGAILSFDIINGEVVFMDLDIKAAKSGSLGYLLASTIGEDCILDFKNEKLHAWFDKRQACSDILGFYGQRLFKKRYWKIVLSKSYDGFLFIEETTAAKTLLTNSNKSS